MDHEPLAARPRSRSLRWVVALLLVVVGSAGLVPTAEGDELARVPATVTVERHRRLARRRATPPPATPRPRARPRLLVALERRVRPMLRAVRRGPPRTPCIVALT